MDRFFVYEDEKENGITMKFDCLFPWQKYRMSTEWDSYMFNFIVYDEHVYLLICFFFLKHKLIFEISNPVFFLECSILLLCDKLYNIQFIIFIFNLLY